MSNQVVFDRWVINKIGLINFWYYDEEEFTFSDGRLLLRGSNGSGKSVTMQSFIPLLLDGNKSPDRLDPFGSRARKLENYLLGEEEGSKDENTGYLYMEFHKPDIGNYITIGMGLRAKRGKPIDFWGFSISDGRRIGRDFLLYKEAGEKIPLSKIELRNRLGSGGEVHDSQGEYMAMVNRLLFGFENLEDYDELIKLLVQLRTPKLSKDFKPTVIYEIMNNSLQPLSDEDLRPMSEAIENMDSVKTQLEALKESKKAADKLKNEYDKYNRYLLLDKARELTNSQERLDGILKEAGRLEKEKEEYFKLYNAAEEECDRLKVLREKLEHKKSQLEQHDSFKAKQEIEKIQFALGELVENKSVKDRALEEKKNRETQLNRETRVIKENLEQQEDEIVKELDEMSLLAEDIHFYEHEFAQSELKSNLAKEYNFKLLRGEVDRYRDKITNARKALELERKQSLEHDKALHELEAARKEREDAGRELEKAENVLVEVKEEFIERTYTWEKNNEHLKLPPNAMSSVSRTIILYGQAASYDDIIGEVRRQYNEVESGLNKSIAGAEAVKSGLKEQIGKKQKELGEWKNQKDPEPPREAKVIANRRRLEKEGIPFVPFYMAVDFHKDVPEDLKGRLEEALADMGLLDALVVPVAFEKKLVEMGEDMGDRYIFPRPQFLRQDLSIHLKPVVPHIQGITFETIDNVLKSIMVDSSDAISINEKGEYSLGILKGKTSKQYITKFLGVEARKRYRQENILRIEAEIRELEGFVTEQSEEIRRLEAVKAVLQGEFKSFPGKEDLETAFNMVKNASLNFDNKSRETVKKEEQANSLYNELKKARDKVRELTAKIELVASLESYQQAEEDINSYRDMLGSLENMQVKLVQLSKRLESLEEQQNEVLADIDSIYGDLRRIGKQIQDNDEKKRNFEELLKELNYDEIKNEIEECIKGLREIPDSIEQHARNAQTLKEKHQTAAGKMETIKGEAEFLKKLNECFKEGFRKEYGLGYVVQYEDVKDMLAAAKRVCSEFKGEDKGERQKEDLTASLQIKHRESSQYMTEYNLTIDYIFESRESLEDARLAKAVASQRRMELSGRIQGRDVNFYTLVNFIEGSIEENERLLKESDRQLFEDILANTVGRKIKARIYHSEEWVKKMNKLMEAMNTSSGLSFSLVWKNRVAETEEQLDTKELVSILKSDSKLLSEEQMEKLAAHFRSKIAQARKELEEKGSSQTFHAIMKDILDYRKWFEFQLFYTKTGESRKELTNNAFYRFSGGEKAMAMYVPLFSSVYARYEGARKDCPRIISLDEAFAGVDENNIRDMFRLIEELKLNYIINSQILWGDYDTVPSLAICELIRPNNADYVTVIRYRWNGRVKELDLGSEFEGPEEAAAMGEAV